MKKGISLSVDKGAIDPPLDNALWRKADVPGDVNLDLMSNILLDEPFVRLNSRQVEAFEDKEWHYVWRFDFRRPQKISGLRCFC